MVAHHYSSAFCYAVFENFRTSYPRATEIVGVMLGLPQNLPVKLLRGPSDVWHRYKVTVQIVHRWLTSPNGDKLFTERTWDHDCAIVLKLLIRQRLVKESAKVCAYRRIPGA